MAHKEESAPPLRLKYITFCFTLAQVIKQSQRSSFTEFFVFDFAIGKGVPFVFSGWVKSTSHHNTLKGFNDKPVVELNNFSVQTKNNIAIVNHATGFIAQQVHKQVRTVKFFRSVFYYLLLTQVGFFP
jgi:hypothetical protein